MTEFPSKEYQSGLDLQHITKGPTYGINTVLLTRYKNRSHLTRLGGDNRAVNIERGNAARGLHAGRGEHQQLSVIEAPPFRAPFAPPRHRSALRLEPGPVPRLLLLLIQSRLFIHFSLLNSGTVFSVQVGTGAELCRPYFSRRCTIRRRRRRGVEQDGILVLARQQFECVLVGEQRGGPGGEQAAPHPARIGAALNTP